MSHCLTALNKPLLTMEELLRQGNILCHGGCNEKIVAYYQGRSVHQIKGLVSRYLIVSCAFSVFCIVLIFIKEMTYRHHMTLDGHCIALDIMDTAGKVSKQTNKQSIKNEIQETKWNFDRDRFLFYEVEPVR